MLFDIQNIQYQAQDINVLDTLNLQIESGQSVLLLGPSGCGKTTLMNLMAGLLKPSSGEVTFDNKKYSSLSENDLTTLRSDNFGFVFQKLHLIQHLSVEQNIAIAQTTPDQKRVQALIDDLGLTGKEKRKAQNLSVGETQRVAIARAVANSPKVIFADEPTSALDDTNAKKVIDLIFDQAKKTGATVIAATHDSRIKDRFENIMEIAA